MVRASPLALEALLRLLGQWRRGVPASCLVAGGWSLHELRAVVLAIVFGWGPQLAVLLALPSLGQLRSDSFPASTGLAGGRAVGWKRIERLLGIELLFG